jgi:hypothetical protein
VYFRVWEPDVRPDQLQRILQTSRMSTRRTTIGYQAGGRKEGRKRGKKGGIERVNKGQVKRKNVESLPDTLVNSSFTIPVTRSPPRSRSAECKCSERGAPFVETLATGNTVSGGPAGGDSSEIGPGSVRTTVGAENGPAGTSAGYRYPVAGGADGSEDIVSGQ